MLIFFFTLSPASHWCFLKGGREQFKNHIYHFTSRQGNHSSILIWRLGEIQEIIGGKKEANGIAEGSWNTSSQSPAWKGESYKATSDLFGPLTWLRGKRVRELKGGLWSHRAKCRGWLWYTPIFWPWAGYLTSLSLSLFIYKMGEAISTP